MEDLKTSIGADYDTQKQRYHIVSCADCKNVVKESVAIKTGDDRWIQICIPCKRIDEALQPSSTKKSCSPPKRKIEFADTHSRDAKASRTDATPKNVLSSQQHSVPCKARPTENPEIVISDYSKARKRNVECAAGNLRDAKASRTDVTPQSVTPVNVFSNESRSDPREARPTKKPETVISDYSKARTTVCCVKPSGVADLGATSTSSVLSKPIANIQDVVDQLLIESDLFESISSFLLSDAHYSGTTSTLILLGCPGFRKFCSAHNTFTPATILEHCPGVSQLWGADGKTKLFVFTRQTKPCVSTRQSPSKSPRAHHSSPTKVTRERVEERSTREKSEHPTPRGAKRTKGNVRIEKDMSRKELEERIVVMLKENGGEMDTRRFQQDYNLRYGSSHAWDFEKALGTRKMKDAILKLPSIRLIKGDNCSFLHYVGSHSHPEMGLEMRIQACAKELSLSPLFVEFFAFLTHHADEGVTLNDIKTRTNSSILGALVGRSRFLAMFDLNGKVGPGKLLSQVPGVVCKNKRFYPVRPTV